MNKPAKFIVILFDILEKESFQNLISWTANGKAFKIKNIHGFQKVLMEEFFNTQNYQSFLRQLSMYHFKMKKNEKNEKIYSHPNFRKGNMKDISLIQRRKKIQLKLEDAQNTSNLGTEMEHLKQQIEVIKLEQQKLHDQLSISFQIQFLIAKKLHQMVDFFAFHNTNSQHKATYIVPFTLLYKLLFGHKDEYRQEFLEYIDKESIIPASPQQEYPISPRIFPLL